MKNRVSVLIVVLCLFTMGFSIAPIIVEPPVTINSNGIRFDGNMFSNNITFYNPSGIRTGTVGSFQNGSLSYFNLSANPDAPADVNGSVEITANSFSNSESSVIKLNTAENGQDVAVLFMTKYFIGLNTRFNDVDTQIFGTSEEAAVIDVSASENSVTINGPLTVTGAVTLLGPLETPKEASVTIAGGSITCNGTWCKVDTEGGAATDELCNILGGVSGQELKLSLVSSNRSVTVLDGGPCSTDLDGPITLTHVNEVLNLFKKDGTWIQETPFSDNH